MAEDPEIPIPIRFNPIKHHRNFILNILKSESQEVIAKLLDPICNNYLDIYTGEMTPEEIAHEVIFILKSKQVFFRDDFNNWVVTGYQKIILKDESEWILRISNETECYIHLHPARTGRFTIRVKGSTIKTVLLLNNEIAGNQKVLSTELVNQIRKQTGLSPIKKLERNKGISKCYVNFFEVN